MDLKHINALASHLLSSKFAKYIRASFASPEKPTQIIDRFSSHFFFFYLCHPVPQSRGRKPIISQRITFIPFGAGFSLELIDIVFLTTAEGTLFQTNKYCQKIWHTKKSLFWRFQLCTFKDMDPEDHRWHPNITIKHSQTSLSDPEVFRIFSNKDEAPLFKRHTSHGPRDLREILSSPNSPIIQHHRKYINENEIENAMGKFNLQEKIRKYCRWQPPALLGHAANIFWAFVVARNREIEWINLFGASLHLIYILSRMRAPGEGWWGADNSLYMGAGDDQVNVFFLSILGKRACVCLGLTLTSRTGLVIVKVPFSFCALDEQERGLFLYIC